jgi:uncharacterized membrane protein YqjE
MLRRAATTLVSLLKLRLELAGIELQEELDRVVGALVLALGGVMLLALACGFIAISITVLLWDTHRVLALAAASGVFLLGGAALLMAASRALKQRPPVFPVSAGQLADDRQALEKT